MKPIWLLLLRLTLVYAYRSPPGFPFPYREELEFLTSEEEERLIFGRDMSVINEKIHDIPEQHVEPPNADEPLPLPTMDPPLPSHLPKKRPPKKSVRVFPFKIPRTLSMLSRMTAPLTRKPRMRSIIPVPTYRSRPSTLVSSDPDQLEIAFKRIEIMAAKAGLNMSSMPRSTQLEVVKRLVPKLPPRMSNLVKTAMDTKSDKMYHYLPEAMPEPVLDHSSPDISSYHIHEDAHDEFDTPVGRPSSSQFDAGKISITASGEGHGDDEFSHLPSITTSYESGPSSGLLPPSDQGHGDYSSHHSYDRSGSHYSRDIKLVDSDGSRIVASPLVSEDFDGEESRDAPLIISANGRTNKAVQVSSVKSSVTPSPVRVALPTKDKITTTRRPIRVSIISKDTISTNRSTNSGESIVKVIHIEPIPDDEEEGVSAHVQEVRDDPPPSTTVFTTRPTQPSRVKEISKDIIQEEEAKHKKERKPVTPTPTTPRPVTTTEAPPLPDLHKLDIYDDWTEDAPEEWAGDPYELTDEEIASTVAELKKYEEQGIFDNSLEQEFPWRLAPHPLEYPDHPDHPKDSVEEVKTESPVEKEKPPTKTHNHQGSVSPKRPPFGGGPMRRPPYGMPRRPPMRRPFPPKRPPHHMRPRPRPPMGPRPFRINEVTVSEIPKEYNKECDYFSEDLCLVVQDYPIEAISEAMEKNPASSSLLVKEPEVSSWVDGIGKAQENSYNFKHYFGIRRSEDETTHRHRDFAGEGGFLCPSKVAYGQVKKAKSSSTGEWKYVVNYADNTQTLRLEKCLSPGNTCSYVMPHYRTACTQVYNYHRLLAWEPERGLHVDVFKVPTCCTCHVQGYYIPQQQHGFTPVRRRDMPPRLKFAPPRTPLGRGGAKKIPPPVTLLKQSQKPWPTPAPVHSSTPKDLKDDLQDLLAQYSALREKIAKKKNENIHVSYSVSVGNGTDSLKPKTRESRTSQYPSNSKLKPLLKLKMLAENLKKLNRTGKPFKGKKGPLARALLMARLGEKLKSAKSRALRSRSMKLKDATADGEVDGSSSKTRLQTRIQMLRSRLNKYNERQKGSDSQRLRTKGRNKLPSENSSSSQRLRVSSNRPSKVNYSYHPIMDYFNSRPGKQAKNA